MNPEMTSLESRLFRGHWQDGSIDLSAGLALATTGVFWLTGPPVGQALAPAVAFVVYPLLRKNVTDPRLGHVRFNARRRSRLRHAHWAMIGLGLVALGLAIGIYFARAGGGAASSLERTLVPGLPAALIALMSIGGAAMLGLGRFIAYAAVLLCAGAAVIALGAHPGWSLLAGGVVVTASGLGLMLRFVLEHPRVNAELEHA